MAVIFRFNLMLKIWLINVLSLRSKVRTKKNISWHLHVNDIECIFYVSWISSNCKHIYEYHTEGKTRLLVGLQDGKKSSIYGILWVGSMWLTAHVTATSRDTCVSAVQVDETGVLAKPKTLHRRGHLKLLIINHFKFPLLYGCKQFSSNLPF